MRNSLYLTAIHDAGNDAHVGACHRKLYEDGPVPDEEHELKAFMTYALPVLDAVWTSGNVSDTKSEPIWTPNVIKAITFRQGWHTSYSQFTAEELAEIYGPQH